MVRSRKFLDHFSCFSVCTDIHLLYKVVDSWGGGGGLCSMDVQFNCTPIYSTLSLYVYVTYLHIIYRISSLNSMLHHRIRTYICPVHVYVLYIGGFEWYVDRVPDLELWVRWTQAGCFSGLMHEQGLW